MPPAASWLPPELDVLISKVIYEAFSSLSSDAPPVVMQRRSR